MTTPEDLGGMIVPKMLSAWLPISAEYLREPTPDERAAMQARLLDHQHEVRGQVKDHKRALARATGLQRSVMELHAPVLHRDELVCRGCDSIGNDYEDEPGWPCRTYRLCTS